MADIEKLLEERGKQHGDFTDHAFITQKLKTVLWSKPNYMTELSDVQREALEMVMHKVGRILAGDPNHKDHWDDIAGYATLASQRLTPTV